MRQRTRLILGFLIAPALPVMMYAAPALIAREWGYALVILVVGGCIAMLITVSLVLPFYLWLRRTGRLFLYWAAIGGGGAFAAVPLITASAWTLLLDDRSSYWADGISYFENGSITWRGFLILFLATPAIAFLLGALCGVAGWLIAFGPRVSPPDRTPAWTPRSSLEAR